MNFPSVAVLDKYGLWWGIGFGMVTTTVGLWVRCLINEGFAFAIIGQTIMAIGQPFLYNAPTKISANWFPERERIVSTSIAAYANIFGIAFGCFVPSIFFTDADSLNPDDARKHAFEMSITLGCIATAVLIPVLLFVRDKPNADT